MSGRMCGFFGFYKENDVAVTIEGYITKIKYRNEENGYTVLNLETEEEDQTVVGNFPYIDEGVYLSVTGEEVVHAAYGPQIRADSYEIKQPQDTAAMQRYLASGAIKGIGEALAERIVKKFGKETFHVMELEPERLSAVKGISERKAREIGVQFEEKKEMRSAMIFLQKYGITTNLAVKIYQRYGNRLYEVMEKNPYRLADDIHGIGFKTVDRIASEAGIPADSDYRIQAGILYVLSQASQSGHVYLPLERLKKLTATLLMLEDVDLEPLLVDMMVDKRIVRKEIEGESRIYPSSAYYMEMNCARMLLDLNICTTNHQKDMDRVIDQIEKEQKIELDTRQRQAILYAQEHGVFILTGGPGTGKTTTINALIAMFEMQGLDLLLAAPTGRAAKRMKEATGHEAQTVHRLLELNGGIQGEEKTGTHFERNEQNPLEADVIIVDEASMLDLPLMHALLKAVVVGSRLILVGDVNQLPSVGPGNVLKDMIHSECFEVVSLEKIFRQAEESDIIKNAHMINHGEQIRMDNKSRDFFVLKRSDARTIQNVVLQLVKQKLPPYVEASSFDIQVLTPMRKGELGVERMNELLQYYLNPADRTKQEYQGDKYLFREGDKVMQIKNNYQIEWRMVNQFGPTGKNGTGVFNGDMGVIQSINRFAEVITVIYDEEKVVEYPFAQSDELELAYAVTIHKSQGSEYPAVVIPLLTGPAMLLNRNLLYTAVTRARKCVTIVGSSAKIQEMIENNTEQKRYTGLKQALIECANG